MDLSEFSSKRQPINQPTRLSEGPLFANARGAHCPITFYSPRSAFGNQAWLYGFWGNRTNREVP